jgi:hypothetical protein
LGGPGQGFDLTGMSRLAANANGSRTKSASACFSISSNSACLTSLGVRSLVGVGGS